MCFRGQQFYDGGATGFKSHFIPEASLERLDHLPAQIGPGCEYQGALIVGEAGEAGDDAGLARAGGHSNQTGGFVLVEVIDGKGDRLGLMRPQLTPRFPGNCAEHDASILLRSAIHRLLQG